MKDGEQEAEAGRLLINYVAEVEEALRRTTQRPLALIAPAEFLLVASWFNEGIPVEAAVRAVAEACDKALATVTIARCDKALRGHKP